MRVYLPATLPIARLWFTAGTVPSGVDGYAVTAGLREWYADGDDEEMEWSATALAGRESLRLLAAAAPAPPRRVVVAADVDTADVVTLDAEDRGRIRVSVPVAVAAWAAVLVDETPAEPVIAAAARAIEAADAGDGDAEFLVTEADDAELLWYATQEFADL